jgi:hypothetical protein
MTNEKFDILKVVLINAGAGLMSYFDDIDLIKVMAENLQTALANVSLILAISYTAWKWSNDIKKKKANLKNITPKKNELN